MAEVKEKVVIRPRTYVIGAIAVFLVVTFTGFLALFSGGGELQDFTIGTWGKELQSDIYFVFFWPLLFSAITSLITKNVKGLSRQELALIISMVWVAWLIPTFYGIIWFVTLMGTARQIPAFQKWTLGYGANSNWIYGPDPTKAELWESWLYGGAVPWGGWMPAITFTIIKVSFYYLSFAFLAALWRRQWVDTEVLPFPYATGAVKLIDMAYEKAERGRSEILKNRFLWLGAVIGFVAIFPLWAPILLPGLGFPKMPQLGVLGLDLTPLRLIPNIKLKFNFEAFWIGACFLVPTTTLLSYIVGAFIFMYLWPASMAYMGIWEPHAVGTSGGVHGFGEALTSGWTGPLMKAWVTEWGAALMWVGIGAMLGLMFYPLFVFRRELVRGIKATFGKAPPEVEAKEPLKYRYLWAGYIICTLLYGIMWWYGSEFNANIAFPFIWMILFGLYAGAGRARTAAEFGNCIDVINTGEWNHTLHYSWKHWWIADPSAPFYISDLRTRYLVLRGDVAWYGTTVRAAPCSSLLEAFKIGSLTGVHSKYIFLGAVIATIIGVITAVFTLLPMWHYYGALHLTEFNYLGPPNNYPQRAPTYATTTVVGDWYRGGFIAPPNARQYISAAIGAIIVIVMYILRARYAWFPLNPAGIALGTGWILADIFVPAIVAYVAKIIVLRIGGVSLYEKKAVPFAIGLMVALSIAIIATNLYRGIFVPR